MPINFSETGDLFFQLVNTVRLTDELPNSTNIIYCSSNVYKLISFFIGLSLIAELCSLDIGWEIVVQTHAETGMSLNKLSSSITAFLNIIDVGFQTIISVVYIF